MQIEVVYGGATYTISDRSLSDVQEHVEATLASGSFGWLEAADGYGTAGPARLLIGPGISVVLVPRDVRDAEAGIDWPS
ncbi:hypothetical protein [Microbacterium imperiale]|uniref:Uncharacterized protein n=1 Tax=Microbacterium imperiale TaxID=33884 RepID=A0A9W6HHS9_9MICO|nr:hypothetical protein [Microbacterium imperiale]MBP2421475.1 hypothetical protein [Microbacterium imperiale]MDS0199418.1 hypothetical protein [Microbacterium imperiale]BFE41814.1 hypothetical protein GCM10017544_27700 [Microbacterium imperiale]GLJ80766.1 hypothetical protein GCM10017586_24490 [Microbacterium imperiale]